MSIVIPTTLADAVAVLAERPDAVILAGGTDLMVDINEGHRRIDPDELVVCVNRVPELRSWTLDRPAGTLPHRAAGTLPHRAAGTLRLGAAVTYAELAAPPLAGLVPALAQAARTVGSPQIRNAATIGGNVVTCSPAGDGLPVLAAVEATVELASAGGVRELPIGEVMIGVKRTALRRGELVTAITVPLLEGWQGYAKVGVRNAMVIAISGACLAVDVPSRSVRLALASVAPTIVRATEAEAFAAGAVDWSQGTILAEAVDEFGRLAATASTPIDDHRSTAAYRRHSIEVLARRLLRRAFTVAGAERVPA